MPSNMLACKAALALFIWQVTIFENGIPRLENETFT